MTSADERRATVLSIAAERLGGEPDEFASPLTVLASPAWRGIEADIWLARRGSRVEVYKHYHPDTHAYVDVDAAIAAAHLAGSLGVGPAVTGTWPELGLMAMDYPGSQWRAGGLQHAVDPRVRTKVIAAKRAFQAGPLLPRDGDIFAEITALADACRAANPGSPANLDAFMDFADRTRQAITAAGIDRVPCHRDGSTSNLLVDPDGQVLLLDYDLAANADPYEDIGCHLVEMFEREPEARAGFEEWTGSFDEGLFQRAMAYGIVDDLRWGLIAMLMAATSPRRHLEFAKYGSWRLLRYELTSQDSAANDRLRRLS